MGNRGAFSSRSFQPTGCFPAFHFRLIVTLAQTACRSRPTFRTLGERRAPKNVANWLGAVAAPKLPTTDEQWRTRCRRPVSTAALSVVTRSAILLFHKSAPLQRSDQSALTGGSRKRRRRHRQRLESAETRTGDGGWMYGWQETGAAHMDVGDFVISGCDIGHAPLPRGFDIQKIMAPINRFGSHYFCGDARVR